MKILIKHARIQDKNSPFHQQVIDLLVEEGKITKTGKKLNKQNKNTTIIQSPQLYATPGWVDMRVTIGDPGYEYREDLISGCNAAAAGGFTSLGLLPDTSPPLTSKSDIEYIRARNRFNAVEIFPYAKLSKNTNDTELTEMMDLKNSGAVAFTNGNRPLVNAGLLNRALLYVKAFQGVIISWPEDQHISENGQINEGITNVQMGIKGIPAIAEEIAINRELELCKYTGSRLHLSKITTARSVTLIKEAKKAGIPVTADTTAYHLFFTEEDLLNYDTNLKVRPPFRSAKDRDALRKAVLEGVIDVVVSDHNPLEEEKKKCEFPLASFGISGIQTLFPVLLESFGSELFLDKIIDRITTSPRKILAQNVPVIKENEPANITLFDPEASWTFNHLTNRSKSSNSPLWGRKLQGKIVAVINKGQLKKWPV